MVKRVIFDIDGTLQSSQGEIRPNCLSALRRLRQAGIAISIWSGNGLEFCRDWSERFDPEGELRLLVYSKVTSCLNGDVAVVDDDIGVIDISECYHAKAILVPTYLGGEDDALEMVVEKLLAS